MTRKDPLSIDTDLPLNGVFHPAGFLLRLATNSQDVLDAAGEAWGHCLEQRRPGEALDFRVVVTEDGAVSGMPVHRAQGHLYSVVADADNFASLDLERLRASVFVSRKTAAEHMILRWCFVESLAYMLLAQRHVVPVHAACVARDGRALLLAAHSMSGKSTLAYACARAGWEYLSDDAVLLLPGSRTVIGPQRQFRFRPDAARLFPELAGFTARVRPNGKPAIEVAVSELPRVRAVESAGVHGIVLLDRGAGAPGLEPVAPEEVLERMLADMPSYGPAVNAMHEGAVRRLAEAPAFRLRYSALDEAIARLETVSEATR
jgi:hypothetical protein